MQLPLQVTFRHLDRTDAIETNIRERAAKLERFHDRITSCRVMVEPVNRSQQKGNKYRVRIDMTVPGKELVVTREADQRQEHEDLYITIRNAFDAAQRQLEEFLDTRRDLTRQRAQG